MFDFGTYGLPWPLLVLALFVVPVAIALFFGRLVLRGRTPLVFRCRRCDASFERPDHHGFPEACPRCRARDWNT